MLVALSARGGFCKISAPTSEHSAASPWAGGSLPGYYSDFLRQMTGLSISPSTGLNPSRLATDPVDESPEPLMDPLLNSSQRNKPPNRISHPKTHKLPRIKACKILSPSLSNPNRQASPSLL